MRRDGAHQRRGVAALWADLRRRIDKAAYARQNAEGVRGAGKLGEAAEVLARYPIAVHLRYLQTMREVASERNITTTFLSEAIEKNNQAIGAAHAARET